jgi:N-methylhydantoinase A
VTDANVVLGRLNPAALLDGRMPIRADLARVAIEQAIAKPLGLRVEDAAEGILTILNETMVRAIRVITVEQGYDPRRFALLAFGGAGPLLAAPLARELGIATTIIPPGPGLLCALGLLLADARRDFSKTRIIPLRADTSGPLTDTARLLQVQADQWFATEAGVGSSRALDWAGDVRYLGQSHELTIPLPDGPFRENAIVDLIDAFAREHERVYGYAPTADAELVTLRVTARAAMNRPEIDYRIRDTSGPRGAIKGHRAVHFQDRGFLDCAIYDRAALAAAQRLVGPAIIEQMDTTAVIFPDQAAECDNFGNMIVKFV